MIDLKQIFFNLMRSSSESFDLVQEQAAEGVWLSDLSDAANFWVNAALKRQLTTKENTEIALTVARSVHQYLLASLKSAYPESPFDQNQPIKCTVILEIFSQKVELSGMTIVTTSTEEKKWILFCVEKVSRKNGSNNVPPLTNFDNEMHENSGALAVWEWNLRTGEVTHNESWANILGYAAEELGSWSIEVLEKIAHPSDLKVFRNYVKDCLRGKRADIRMEARMKHKSGEWIWVLGQAKVVSRMEDGKPERLLGFHQDITNIKSSFENISINEEKYRFLFLYNPSPMWIFDLTTFAFLEVNQAAIEHYGYSREEFLSMTIKDIRPSEDLERLSQISEMARPAYIATQDWRHIKKNGEIIYVNINSYHIDYMGRPARHVVINDITQLKKVQEALQLEKQLLRSIIDNIPVFITHYKGEEVFSLNREFQDKIGWRVEDNFQQPIIDRLYPDSEYRAQAMQYMAAVSQEWREFELQTKFGSTIYAEWSNISIEDGSLIGIGIETTQRRKIFQELRKSELLNEVIKKVQTLFISTEDDRNTFKSLLLDIINLTNAAYGFIGEVLYKEDRTPYLKTYAITDISWNEEVKKLFDDQNVSGMEFHNLKTLFGRVITSGEPVISNDPKNDPNSHGLPKGHPPLNSFMGIPIFHDRQLLGMVGLGNKPDGFQEELLTYLEPLMSTIGQLLYSIDQKRKSIQVKQKLKDLSLIATNTDDLIIITDAHGHIEYVNDAFERRTDYLLSEVKGLKPGSFLQGKDTDPAHIAAFREGLNSGKSFNQEILNYTKSGEPYWLSCTISPVIDDLGEIEKFIAIQLDITETVNSRRALQRANRMLTQTNEVAQVGGWEANFETNELFWSPLTKRIHEVPNDFVPDIETAINFYKEGESRMRISEAVEQLVKYGTSYDMELQIVTLSGNVLWVRTAGEGEFLDGKCTRIFGAFQNIDDRKRNQLALAESMAQFASVVEAIPDIILKFDSEGTFVDCYTRDESKLLIPIKKMLGKKLPEVIPPEVSTLFLEKIRETLQKAEVVEFEYEFINPSNGVALYEEARMVKVDSQHVICLIRNITDRVKSDKDLISTKQKLESIFQEMTDAVYSIDFATDTVLFASPSMESILGYPLSAYVGKSSKVMWEISIHKEDIHVIEEIRRDLKSKGSFEKEYRVIDADGKLKWTLNKGKVIYDSHKRPVRVDGIATEITEKKVREAELQRILRLSDDQNKRLQNFAHIVSHNMRSHSANLESLLYVMADQVPELKDNEYFQMFFTVSKNLEETIYHLNEVVDITFTQESLTRLNLKKYVEKQMLSVANLASEAAVVLINQVADDQFVQAIPAYLESIIMNLITNGVKYRSDERNSYLRITSEREKDYIVLSFSDNGLGMELPQVKPKLFGMYKTFHDNEDSRGVGLFITKNQVEAMDGKIEVESEVNVGTTFKIYLKRG